MKAYAAGPESRVVAAEGIRCSTVCTIATRSDDRGPMVRTELQQAMGRELRSVRLERHLTLDGVRRLSSGRFKPSALGGYERAERVTSIDRFCELARLCRLPADRLLADVLRSLEPSGSRVVVDLTRLSASKDPDAGRVAAFVHDIRARRGDLSDMITLRSGDLDSLAGTVGLPGAALLERIPEALRWRGPAGDRRSSSR